MKINLKIGDVILTGKWQNKRVTVEEFGTNELGQPTVNGKPMLRFRIAKFMPEIRADEGYISETYEMRHIKLFESYTNK